MNKLKLLSTCIVFSLSLGTVTPSHALVVSDPGTYARLAKDLTEQRRQFEALGSIIQETKETVNNISGNLKRGLGVSDEISKIIDAGNDFTRSIEGIPSLAEVELDKFEIEDFRKVFDDLYNPNETFGQRAKTNIDRADYEQKTLKGLLENAEFILSEQEESFQKFSDLSNQADSTQSLKDSTDVLNRLVTELLIIEQQQLLLMSQIAKADTLTRYQGVDSELKSEKNNTRNKYNQSNKVMDAFINSGDGRENTKEAEEFICIIGGC